MHIPERLIRLAKQRAVAGFTTLLEQTVVEADVLMSKSMHGIANEQRGGPAARALLRSEDVRLRKRIGEHFLIYLERALQTMHTDLRKGLHEINADNLTLIEDDVVIRQIEIDRLVQRLRDADTISLGRINLIIAQMHEVSEVRERENPFRPYLLARALHEGLREIARDEHLQRLLFDAMSHAMSSQLSGFYAGILEVFEAGGVSSRLTARPSAMSRTQRDRLAWQRAAEQLSGQVLSASMAMPAAPGAAPGTPPQQAAQLRMLPKLKRLMEMQGGGNAEAAPSYGIPDIPSIPHGGFPVISGGNTIGGNTIGGSPIGGGNTIGGSPIGGGNTIGGSPMGGGNTLQGGASAEVQRQQAAQFQDLVWDMFKQPKAARFPRAADAPQAPATIGQHSLLDMQLMQMQRAAARDLALEDPSIVLPQPLDVREKIADTAAAGPTRMTLDLVSLLFESIVHDEHLAEPVRKDLGRLQVPFLRAAILDPSMLHEANHPARSLLDRIGAVAAGITEDNPDFPALQAEIGKSLATVLERFNGDVSVFAEAEQQLDDYVTSRAPSSDPVLGRCAAAVQEAEAATARLPDTVSALCDLLEPLRVDPRVVTFVTATWARVLAQPSGAGAAHKALLPELLWSAQEKPTPEERTQLMRLLPDLVRRVREGLATLGLADADMKTALDLLVNVHMDVLGSKQAPALRQLSIDQWRHRFDSFTPGERAADAPAATAIEVSRAALESALARHDVSAMLITEQGNGAPQPGEAEWLATARAGAGFELMIDGSFVPARLSLVTERRSVYLFSMGDQNTPVILVRAALLDALRSGTLQSAEYAPVFDRAVESLLAGADALTP